jgi:hypothetical protein
MVPETVVTDTVGQASVVAIGVSEAAVPTD